MRILLLKTWKSNIGNGFIDAGARETINQAFPDAEVIEASGFPNLVANRKPLGEFAGICRILQRFGGDQIREKLLSRSTLPERIVNIGELVDVDLCVLPGCVLYDHVFEKYDKTIQHILDQDVPLVILGGGGGNYSPETVEYVRDYIEGIDNLGLITRDSTAYQKYKDIADYAYDGIDCAFFISDWYDPVTANQKFVTTTFDKTKAPTIRTGGYREIRTDHTPFGDERPYQGAIKKYIEKYRSQEFFTSEHLFTSDSIEDYLFLYANAVETHADRIHACVPALAYGNPARFYFDTPRAKLFDRILNEDISRGVVRLDQETLQTEKANQVSALKEAVETIST